MPGNRIGRINEEIQREMAALVRQLKDPRVSGAGMVTVTRAEATADLRYCKVYISALDKEREREALKGLKSAAGFLRRELGQSLRLRYTPELQFQGDDSIARGARVLEVLRNVTYSPQDGGTEAEAAEPDAESVTPDAETQQETPGGGTEDVPC